MVVGTRQYRPADARSKLGHIAQERLDHIVRQVNLEDYHAERFSAFHECDRSPVETMGAIHDWAKSVNLMVTLNYAYDICVFERLVG